MVLVRTAALRWPPSTRASSSSHLADGHTPPIWGRKCRPYEIFLLRRDQASGRLQDVGALDTPHPYLHGSAVFAAADVKMQGQK
jgi:hypothetical protein